MTRRSSHAVLVPLLAVLGCIGGVDSVSGTRTLVGGGAVVNNQRDPQLLGRWTRTIFYHDNDGSLHSSQLTWEFMADGGARRVIFTQNLAFGLADTEIVQGIWSTERNRVTIDFLPPSQEKLQYQYFVGTTRLVLGPFELERAG